MEEQKSRKLPRKRVKYQGVVNKATETCLHPAIFKGLCVSCGMKVEVKEVTSSQPTSAVSLGDGLSLHISEHEASRVQSDKLEGLRNARKLALILDLDNTLLHATVKCNRQSDEIHEVIMRENQHSYKYFVKFRPHLTTFLKKMQENYRMYIYTNGTQLYAENICSVIDPDGSYFSKRIIARTNDPKSLDKSLRKVFLADWSMALVIDDRMDVWHDEQLNHVMNIRPYIYFEEATAINNAPGVSSLAPSPAPDATEEDDYLLHYSGLLNTLHERYYKAVEVLNGNGTNGHTNGEAESEDAAKPPIRGISVGDLLTDLRLQALRRCSIVFSGLIPLHETANPEKNTLWRMATTLGATVSHTIDDSTTHLISSTPHTSKVKRVILKKLAVKIVNPNWLLNCHFRMEALDEQPFLLEIPESIHSIREGEEEESAINALPFNNDQISDPPILDDSPPERKRSRTSSTCSSDDEWLDQFEDELHGKETE